MTQTPRGMSASAGFVDIIQDLAHPLRTRDSSHVPRTSRIPELTPGEMRFVPPGAQEARARHFSTPVAWIILD